MVVGELNISQIYGPRILEVWTVLGCWHMLDGIGEGVPYWIDRWIATLVIHVWAVRHWFLACLIPALLYLMAVGLWWIIPASARSVISVSMLPVIQLIFIALEFVDVEDDHHN